MPAIQHPEFRPDPALSREEMERLQQEIADAARFEDDHGIDLDAVGANRRLSDPLPSPDVNEHPPTVVGIDQAFRNDDAVSAAVALQGGEVIERAHAVEPLNVPYVPGLLAFREGESIASALEALDAEPDCLLLDGSGRIHFREAGIATHVGVLFDLPAVGVAKSLLCGTPAGKTDGLSAGERVAIVADDSVTAPDGETIGYAVQTRQFDSPNRHVNPVYVSPGHRVSEETAAEIALTACEGYKLPEPIRLADAWVGELTSE